MSLPTSDPISDHVGDADPLWIVGAGGVGREARDAALTTGGPVAGFVDERRRDPLVDLPVVPPGAVSAGDGYLIAIADPGVRARLAAVLDEQGARPRSLAHAGATVASGAQLGPGSLLLCGAYVSVAAALGRHCQVHYNATIGHDAVLRDFVTVLPGANVSGSVTLGEGATVGAGAVVLQGLQVGAGAFVGAGAVVTRDVEPGAVVIGAPARPLSR